MSATRPASPKWIDRVVVEACTNIALVKYWGKRPGPGNLPAVGSLSLTLDGLASRTELRLDPALGADAFFLDGERVSGEPARRVTEFLSMVRAESAPSPTQPAPFAEIRSRNSFPTASGLASSASGFAALALAAARAYGLPLDGKGLSQLARRGSGSAARSLFGGFVILHRGERDDGADCYAERLEDPGSARWDLRMVLALAGEKPKTTLSTSGMNHTAATSPYYRAWVESQPADLAAAREAVARRDLEALGEIAERSCLTMHASAIAARPGILYWTGATVDGFHAVRRLRSTGVGAWFTNDAGPHVKALCSADDAQQVAETLAAVPGIGRTIVCPPGAAARVLEDSSGSAA